MTRVRANRSWSARRLSSNRANSSPAVQGTIRARLGPDSRRQQVFRARIQQGDLLPAEHLVDALLDQADVVGPGGGARVQVPQHHRGDRAPELHREPQQQPRDADGAGGPLDAQPEQPLAQRLAPQPVAQHVVDRRTDRRPPRAPCACPGRTGRPAAGRRWRTGPGPAASAMPRATRPPGISSRGRRRLQPAQQLLVGPGPLGRLGIHHLDDQLAQPPGRLAGGDRRAGRVLVQLG